MKTSGFIINPHWPYIGASPNSDAHPMIQTILGAWPDLGTQPCCKALRFNYVTCKRLTLGEWGCLFDNGPKMAVGHPNSN